MNNKLKRIINRIISRSYKISQNKNLRLNLINLATYLFKSSKNKVEFDITSNLYWLRYNGTYLKSVQNPYFDFSIKLMSKQYREIFCKHYVPKDEDIIVDVGAGIGSEVFFFQNLIGSNGSLYNIEASPKSFTRLETLCKKNYYSNCHNFNLAISNNEDKLYMEEGDNYVINTINRNSKGVEIPAITFDKFVKQVNLKRINFLKVNIEGSEFEMFDSMHESLKIIDNIAISCHDFLFDGTTRIRDKVVKTLKQHNFEIYYSSSKNEIFDSWIYGSKKRILTC